MITSTLLSLLLPALVSAHGYVYKVSIDGKDYPGNPVGTTASVQSVIRQVATNSPVKGATNPDVNCGSSAMLAASAANANPGSTVEVYWVGGTSGSSDKWPHNTGPIMHYMTQCQGSCTSYNSSNAKWFKISEQGQKPGGSGWYQADIQSGSPATVAIPNDLAPGNYLLRSELIALQLAMSQGGAEFYPACIQLSVGGSQTSQPTSSELVSLPGAYSDTDPGILCPNVYNPGFNYSFPGPPVANLASGGSATGSSGGSGASSPAMPSPSAASPSASSPAGPSASMPGTGSSGGSGASTPAMSSPVGPSASSMPSTPANAGGDPPSSVTASTSYPTSTGGGSSTCMRKRTASEPRIVNEKRMHRRRYRTSH